MNILAVGAHGDDLEYFCGGTLARCAQRGDRVVMCVVTDGRGRPKGNPDEIAAIRKQEAQAAADVIGAELVWLAIPDGELVVNLETRHLFVETIRAANPDVIIAHPSDDYHPDHTASSKLVIEASQVARTSNFPSKLPPIRKPVPIAMVDTELGIDFNPEEYVDISDVWEQKTQMLLKHVSQHMPVGNYDPNFVMPPNDQNPFLRAARVMSEFRGLACGTMYAEGFRWWRSANRIVPRRLLP
jgi:LmbE family N-acetylglucosaminyl deacetylase